MLVLPREGRVPASLSGWRAANPGPTTVPSVCVPQGQATHLLLRAGSTRSSGVVLVAVAAPAAGSTVERAATQAIIEVLSARTGGPMAAALGQEQARRAAPRLLDVGGAAGAGGGVILMGLAGTHDVLRRDLETLAHLLHRLGDSRLTDEITTAGAARRIAARHRAVTERPGRRLTAVGSAALHGPPAPSPIDGVLLARVSQRLFAPWRWAVVGVGREELGDVLKELAPLHTWQDGRRIAGPELPRCRAD